MPPASGATRSLAVATLVTINCPPIRSPKALWMELGTGAWLWRGVWSLAAAASTLHGTMCVAAGPVADWLTGTTPAPVQIGGPQPISAYYGGTVIAAQPVNDPAAQVPPSLPMPSSGGPIQGVNVLPPGSVMSPGTAVPSANVMPPSSVMPPSTTGWGYPSGTCASGQCGVPMTPQSGVGVMPPAAPAPQAGVGRSFFGSYASVNNRTPVTYYRPVVSVDPVTNQTFTSLQPCTSYEMQLQRQYRLLGRPSIHGSGVPPAVAMPQTRGVPGQSTAYRPVVPGSMVISGVPGQVSYYGAPAGQLPQRLPYTGTALTSSPGVPTSVPTAWGSPVVGAMPAPAAMLPPSPSYIPAGAGLMPGGVVPASGLYPPASASYFPAQPMNGYSWGAPVPAGISPSPSVPFPAAGSYASPAPLSPGVSASAVPMAGYPAPVYPAPQIPAAGYPSDTFPSSSVQGGSNGGQSVWPPASGGRWEGPSGDPEASQPPSLPPSAGSEGHEYRSSPNGQSSYAPASDQLGRAAWGDDWRREAWGEGDFTLQPILPPGSAEGRLATDRADFSKSQGVTPNYADAERGNGRSGGGATATELEGPEFVPSRLDRPERPIPLGGEESMPRWSPGLLQTQDRTAAGAVVTAASVATAPRSAVPSASKQSQADVSGGRFAETDRLLDNLQLRSSPSR